MNLEYNIEEHVKGVVQAANAREKPIHLFLEGFLPFTQDVMLNKAKAKNYLVKEIGNYKKFTPLISSNLILNLHMAAFLGVDFRKPLNLSKMSKNNAVISKRRIEKLQTKIPFSVHLPFSEKHHLEFLLADYDGQYIFPAETCELCDDSHGFPFLYVRKSGLFDLSEDGAIFYDNRISPMHFASYSGKEELKKCYNSMRNFVKASLI